jgi:hypothetical protein
MESLDQASQTTKLKVPDYDASPRQTLFHTASADEKLYGGAAGGGKTAAIVAECVTLALEYPGIPINMFRRTRPELNKTIKPEITRQCANYIRAKQMWWQTSSNSEGEGNSYVFANGSRITLNYLDNESDMYRYQGAQMPIIAVDELTQFPQAWIEYLITRNRSPIAEWPVFFMAGTNPGGIGHGWVKSRFIDPAPPGQRFNVTLPDGNIRTRIFIPAKLDDHPDERFRRDYNKVLQATSNPQLRRALREGNWDLFAGQVFTEFMRDFHTCDPFHIPDHWQRWRCMDYGNHNSVFWLARSPITERIYVYREYCTQQFVSVGEKSRNIKQFENSENISYGLADPALWNGQGDHESGDSLATMFAREGVSWMPANNDRMAGLAAVHEFLSIQKDGWPKLIIFNTCTSLILTLPALPYDKIKVDDVDTHADDHDYDALRYGLMAFVTPAEDEDEPQTTGDLSSLWQGNTLH